MNEEEARALISGGESQTVEFKESLAQQRPAIKTLAAFGSQAAGGAGLFGVKDDGEIKPVQIGATTIEKLAGEIENIALSMVSAEPLLPKIEVVAPLGVVAVYLLADENRQGPLLAYGRRFERVGRSTHEVKLNYRQLARAHNEHLYDPESSKDLGYRFCPKCGSERLTSSQALDYAHDEIYYFVTPQDCGWSDWTQ